MQWLLEGQKSVFSCWKSFGYLSVAWQRLDIPATLNGLGCSVSPLAWSQQPSRSLSDKSAVLQTDALTHNGVQGIAVKSDTLSFCFCS